jgi:dynein heavy chain
MVWVDPQNLGYRPFYERWVRTRLGNSVEVSEEKQPAAEFLLSLFDRYIPRCIDLILSGIVDSVMGIKLKQVIPITNIDMVKQLCSVIDAHLSLDIVDPVDIEYIYIFSVIWSLGATLLGSDRVKLDAFVKKLSREPLPDGILFDYFYDVEMRRWEQWQSLGKYKD